MHIMTKFGDIVEGEPLTEQQVFEIEELPNIIDDFPYKYFTKDEQKHMAKYLAEKLDIRKKAVVEDEVQVVPEPEVELLVYPEPKSIPLVETSEDDSPMF